MQGAACLDDRPLLGVGPVAGVHLDRGEVRAVRAADVQAQAAVADDLTGGPGPAAATAAATAAAAAGRCVGRDVLDAHRAARGGRAGGRGAVAYAVREPAAHGQVEDDGQVVVEGRLPRRGADLALGHREVLVAVEVEGDRLVRGIRPVLDHRVGVVAGLAAGAGTQPAAVAVALVAYAARVRAAVHGPGDFGQRVDVLHDVDLAVFRPLAGAEHPERRPVAEPARRVGLLDRGGDLQFPAGGRADIGGRRLDAA